MDLQARTWPVILTPTHFQYSVPGTSQLMLHLHHSRTGAVEPRCLCRASASRETSFIRNHELRDRKKCAIPIRASSAS
jgi:hypothetical protein